MICPHGLEVGDPPQVERCPRGFPGCACGDDLTLHMTEADEQTHLVAAWWMEHGNL